MTGGCATGKGTITGKGAVDVVVVLGENVGAAEDPSLVRGKGGAVVGAVGNDGTAAIGVGGGILTTGTDPGTADSVVVSRAAMSSIAAAARAAAVLSASCSVLSSP